MALDMDSEYEKKSWEWIGRESVEAMKEAAEQEAAEQEAAEEKAEEEEEDV